MSCALRLSVVDCVQVRTDVWWGLWTQLILTDTPRLLVLSAWSGKFKKEISLTRDTKVNPIGQHTFDIISVRTQAVEITCNASELTIDLL